MRLKSKFYPVVLVLLIFCVLSAFSQDGTEPILATDLLKLKVINQIDISPDGSKVVFVLSSMGKDDGGQYRYYRHLWLIDLEDPTSPIQLTYGDRNDSSPTWSPNGSQIAFVRQHKKRPQVWILPLRGGEAYRVSDAEFGASNPQWSPDGRKILFSSMIPDWAIEGEPTWFNERPGRNFRDTPNWKKIEKQKKGKEIEKGEHEEKETKNESEETVIAKPEGTLEAVSYTHLTLPTSDLV